MAEPLADQVLRKIGEARELYHRLILMVGPAGSGKTSALQEVSASTSAPLINVNLELSRRMLDLTERQRKILHVLSRKPSMALREIRARMESPLRIGGFAKSYYISRKSAWCHLLVAGGVLLGRWRGPQMNKAINMAVMRRPNHALFHKGKRMVKQSGSTWHS